MKIALADGDHVTVLFLHSVKQRLGFCVQFAVSNAKLSCKDIQICWAAVVAYSLLL